VDQHDGYICNVFSAGQRLCLSLPTNETFLPLNNILSKTIVVVLKEEIGL
jgi:hypothetical protein